MDLTILYSTLDESLYSVSYSSNSFFKSIKVYSEKMPDYKLAHLALFGIKEERGTQNNLGCAQAPDEIRKKLYTLKKGNGAYNIVDLGNLNPGIDLEETYVRVSEVCRILLENNVLPVLLGGTQDIDYAQYRGYEDMEKLVNFLKDDAFLDMVDGIGCVPARQHIHTILL